jgi:hypothetical protein
VAQEHLPRFGQLDAAGARRALDQALSDQTLERADLLTDRRLDVAEAGRGTPKRAFFGNGFECGEMPDLDPGRVIDPHGLSRF